MFERPDAGERAILVYTGGHDDPEDVAELRELASSAGADTVAQLVCGRRAPDPRHFIGQGKVEELRQLVQAYEADLVLFDHELSPSQERNLEKTLSVRVVDRTGLILDIFAQRARTFEGKLQVELAQLRHLSTRLVRGWTHLERQKGGIGLRGPGETQLETDRRLLANRIRMIEKRLDKVDRQRDQNRSGRKRADVPTVSLVGYTNAGKSTLFNALTQAKVYAADQLFATLDPTMRRLLLPHGGPVVLGDTVGFIRHLPHELVAAFRSTLQEACESDVLLHVVDAGATRRDETMAAVSEVLTEIGADKVPQIEVFNKIDLLDGAEPRVERDENGVVRRVWLSALSGEGLTLLAEALESRLAGGKQRRRVRLTASQGSIRARLFQLGAVLRDVPDDSGGWCMDVELAKKDLPLLDRAEAASEVLADAG
ncbi:ribosome rescue GTPase HflX [Methylogaea oryzae]|uniref:ribosome rescue GTPase HflX n=1 Tax=Methylogaea oryzae TaxID=1295382 RepID=UPI0006CFC14C|nr:ribosome rescue GTPase HflX [Methylogaea oryzae]